MVLASSYSSSTNNSSCSSCMRGLVFACVVPLFSLALSPSHEVAFTTALLAQVEPVQYWLTGRSSHERRAEASSVPVALRCAALAYARGVEAALPSRAGSRPSTASAAFRSCRHDPGSDPRERANALTAGLPWPLFSASSRRTSRGPPTPFAPLVAQSV